MAEARTLVVGVFDNPPIVLGDENGGPTGLSVDMLRNVAETENWTLEFIHAPWQQLLTKLDKGDIDLLVGIAFTPARAKQYDFTQQTLLNNYGLVMRRPKVSVTSLFDLRDKTVALMAKSIHSREFDRLMQEFSIRYTPMERTSYEAVLQALNDGIADAGVVNRANTIWHAAQYDAVATGIVFNPVEVRYAAPRGKHADVLAALDRALAAQKHDPNSEYQRLLNHWMGTPVTSALPSWALVLAGFIILLLALLVISNYVIRQRVSRRTAELTESETRFRQLAENVKDVFWVCSPDWDEIFYISPAYETTWGLSAEDLYANPNAWLDPVHPADRGILEQSLRARRDTDFSDPSLPEFRIVGSDGRTHWIQARAYPIHDEQGRVVRVAGLAEDITERRAAEDTIRFMAYHDPLTRLHNRHSFEARLRAAVNRNDRLQRHALMYVDLDQFKVLNDTCGHTAGDQMLQGLTAQLQRAILRDHTLARLGGDEFGVLVENCDLTDAETAAQQILDSIRAFRFTWEDKIFSVGASIGLVMIEGNRRSVSGLLSAADIACYAAKDSGRNRVHVYHEDDAMLQQRADEMHWVGRLKQALENDGFVLHAQPIVPLQLNNQPAHREFLLRMLDNDGQLIPPGNFLPAAERFDLMPALDRWVISQVFAYIGAAPDDGGIAFINLSGQVLNDDGLVSHVLQEMHRHKVSPGRVCLEITETAAIANLAKATRLIEALREQGVRFALDDFGTGMSSFSYLKTLPVDYLKIDGFFIKDLQSDHMNPAIVEAITQIGHTAGLQVIAEWVEDKSMLTRLRQLGIDFAQGYALGRPDALPPSARTKQ